MPPTGSEMPQTGSEMPQTGSEMPRDPQTILPSEPLTIPDWAACRWLRHGFSTRAGGTSAIYAERPAADLALNLGFSALDDADRVRENRRRFEESMGASGMQLVAARQVHGVEILRVDRPEQTGLEADGLVTDRPGLLLGMQAADCAAILLVDVRLRAVAALHAGWRGTAGAIAERGVVRMTQEFGSRPQNLRAAIGPAIGPCCYTVGEEVWRSFTERFPYGEQLFHQGDDGGLRLDLAEANRRQLLATGVPAEQIVLTGVCTACARVGGLRRFFSHRAEAGRTGRAMGAIGIAAE